MKVMFKLIYNTIAIITGYKRGEWFIKGHYGCCNIKNNLLYGYKIIGIKIGICSKCYMIHRL